MFITTKYIFYAMVKSRTEVLHRNRDSLIATKSVKYNDY